MNGSKKSFDVRRLALVGVLTALVFAMSSIGSIQINEVSRIHLGNIMCLLSGVLFGPFIGGLSAGLGSMLYDFTNPLFLPEFWITFLTKFAMGFVAGWLFRRLERLPTGARYVLPALAGQLTYILLFFVKNVLWQLLVYRSAPGAALVVAISGVPASLINGAIAVVAVALFAPVLRAALDRAHFLPRPKAG